MNDRRRQVRRRGHSLFEVLIGLAILGLLFFAVGDAVTQTLRDAALSGGRAAAARSISELTARLLEDARSSSAVFIPASDVFGSSNAADVTHEIDFFRRLSAGGDSYVAYFFDAGAHTVTRYEYSLVASGASIIHSDVAAADIALFSAVRARASEMSGVADPAAVSDVPILYGVSGVEGGNGIVRVSVQAVTRGAPSGAPVEIDLASRASPTSLAILAPAHAPPAPGPVRTIPFVIRHVSVNVHHGVWHFGDAEGVGIHQSQVMGTIQWYAPDSTAQAADWLEVASFYPVLESGSYTFTNSSGSRITLVVSCGPAACPKFSPLPTSGPPPPTGGVGFDALP